MAAEMMLESIVEMSTNVDTVKERGLADILACNGDAEYLAKCGSFLQRNWGHLTDDIEAGALVGQHINELDLSALQPSSRRRGTYPLFWLVSAAT